MVIQQFPDISLADENGLLAVGGDTEVESLLLAYKSGIFPWPINDEYLTWFAPPQRAVLFTENFHISKSLKKLLNRNPLTITYNTCFQEVIESCAESANRGDQPGTWITQEILDGYIALHNAGYAYSVEAKYKDKLCGGLYGVRINGMISGESMFYTEPNASKVCLVFLMRLLQKQAIPWLDCQVLTPLLESFGAIEVARDQYKTLLGTQLSDEKTIELY